MSEGVNIKWSYYLLNNKYHFTTLYPFKCRLLLKLYSLQSNYVFYLTSCWLQFTCKLLNIFRKWISVKYTVYTSCQCVENMQVIADKRSAYDLVNICSLILILLQYANDHDLVYKWNTVLNTLDVVISYGFMIMNVHTLKYNKIYRHFHFLKPRLIFIS